MVSSGTCRLAGTARIRILILVSITAVLLVSMVSAAPGGITIYAQGEQGYPVGEELVFSGYNYDSNATYLFMIGPNLPPEGGKLTSPFERVVSGDPGSFDIAPAGAEHQWELSLLSAPLGIAPGAYWIYAVSDPVNHEDLASAGSYNTTIVMLKEPTLTAEVVPSIVRRGDHFTVSGQVKEYPDMVQVWIIGPYFLYNAIIPVLSDKTYSLKIDTNISEILPEGQSYLFVQDPRGGNIFNIAINGDWVQKVTPEGTTMNLFKFQGAGSLQGRDAAEALMAAFRDAGSDDVYTVIPLAVNRSQITAYELIGTPVSTVPAFTYPSVTATTPAPAIGTDTQVLAVTSIPESAQPIPANTQPAPLQYAHIGAILLAGGMALWSRR
ncbi:MAG: hypothetical protein M0Q92_12560 [Methanoregula sp.]|jgi:hypothetical protein|nr:hypothetical protein [Methanoregula sp.]